MEYDCNYWQSLLYRTLFLKRSIADGVFKCQFNTLSTRNHRRELLISHFMSGFMLLSIQTSSKYLNYLRILLIIIGVKHRIFQKGNTKVVPITSKKLNSKIFHKSKKYCTFPASQKVNIHLLVYKEKDRIACQPQIPNLTETSLI